jgi:hypothetical protein
MELIECCSSPTIINTLLIPFVRQVGSKIYKAHVVDFQPQHLRLVHHTVPKELGKWVRNWVSVLSSSSSLSFHFISYTAREKLVPRLRSYKLASQNDYFKNLFIGAGCLLGFKRVQILPWNARFLSSPLETVR